MRRLKRFLTLIVTSQPFPVEMGLMLTAFALAVLFILPGSTTGIYGYLIDDAIVSALFLCLTVVQMISLLALDKGLRTAIAAFEIAVFSFITYSSQQAIPNGYGVLFAVPTIGALYALVRLGDKNAI